MVFSTRTCGVYTLTVAGDIVEVFPRRTLDTGALIGTCRTVDDSTPPGNTSVQTVLSDSSQWLFYPTPTTCVKGPYRIIHTVPNRVFWLPIYKKSSPAETLSARQVVV